MARALHRAEVEELAESVRRLLDALDAGEMDATAVYRARVEGALCALESVLGDRSALEV